MMDSHTQLDIEMLNLLANFVSILMK